MSGSYGRASVRWFVGVGLAVLGIGGLGCAADGAALEDRVEAESAALGGAGAGACSPKDTQDTTCNAVDDDCDGVKDEDCDFGPAQCPAGYKVIAGTYKDDYLTGTSGRDCILGYGGNDTLYGLSGDDLIVGGPGKDKISGGGGNDTIRGGMGDDTIDGNDGSDTIDGNDGNDTIDGGSSNDTIRGGACHDYVKGGTGTDKVWGDNGSDRLVCSATTTTDGGPNTDACDGTNCELSSKSRVCSRDSDCGNGKVCVRSANVGICVPTAEKKTKDATCDGLDDDCDGKYDEDYIKVNTTCGSGSCTATGVTSCVKGQIKDSCMPPPSCSCAPNDATCNGVDDDCNGTIDEDYASTPTSCGTGACARTGTNSCVGGAVVNSCSPGSPAPSDATCNGVDDNCNGSIDEGFVSTPTTCGVGACIRSGTNSCSGGMVVNSCSPGSPAPSDASCDGIDNNCNGSADEGYVPTPTMCGVGACAAVGSNVCMMGVIQNTCMPGTPGGSDASCNNADDDCDGSKDEDYVPTSTSCGIGACGSTGQKTCSAGAEIDSCTPGTPAADDASCNNSDDDCNGAKDEDYVPTGSTCGVGACHATGTKTCSAGAVVDSCTPGTPAANDASCNNIDNDCNGSTDEDYVASCSGTETLTCVSGAVVHTDCDNDNMCDGDETCSAGTCQPGTPPNIDDGNPCTSDTCDTAFGIQHTPVAPGTSCSDGNSCDGAETCVQTAGCLPPRTDVFSWWPGDGDANDIKGGLNGTPTNVNFPAGHVAQGFAFPGTNSKVNLSAHAADINDLNGNATLEFWTKVPNGQCRTVFHVRQDINNEQYLQIGDCSPDAVDEDITWTYVSGGFTTVLAYAPFFGTELADGNWHHVAITFDGGFNTWMYLDGAPHYPTTIEGADATPWGGFATPANATLGSKHTSAGDNFQDGILDEVTLYSTGLSDEVILAIYQADFRGKCKPPVCTEGAAPANGTSCENGGHCQALMCVP